MNRTSLGSRLVSSAARSPGRSSTGPEVCRRFTPISLAMMWASVVFPSPGGPNSSTWSRDSPRFLAASMKICNWPRIFSWPMYSSNCLGRRALSSASSCVDCGSGVIRRSVSIILHRRCEDALPASTAAALELLQQGPDLIGTGIHFFGQRKGKFLDAAAYDAGQLQDRGHEIFLAQRRIGEALAVGVGCILDGEAHLIVFLVPDILHAAAFFLDAGDILELAGKRQCRDHVRRNRVVDDLRLLAADVGMEVREQNIQLLGGKFARVEILPLRAQPAEIGEIVRDLRHDRLQQCFLGAPPLRVARIPVGSEVFFLAQPGEQTANGDQAFLLQVIVADRYRRGQVVQLDELLDLLLLVGVLVSGRSEEHTSELQSPDHLVCRLLLEKKKQIRRTVVESANAERGEVYRPARLRNAVPANAEREQGAAAEGTGRAVPAAPHLVN